jgi:cysteine-rich repeat protein
LFSLGEEGTSYSNAAQAAETAADGGAFIVCAFTSSQDCQLFARACEEDSDCPPGTLCNLDGVSTVGTAFCNAPGEARDDVYEVERDVAAEVNPIPLDVLANDSLSESACVDPRFTILAVCGDGVQSQYEMDNADSCPTEPEPIGTVTFDEGDGEITYDAPEDGSCGFFDTFVYTVDLGGGVIDTAQVRVAVNCVCGDGITDGSEQCDEGEFNGDAGTCVEGCGGASEVIARCSEACLLNVLCGDGYIVAPEECDDTNTDNGDGCSSVCTRESECGNGEVELGEECDGGPTGNATCTANCVLRECGDAAGASNATTATSASATAATRPARSRRAAATAWSSRARTATTATPRPRTAAARPARSRTCAATAIVKAPRCATAQSSAAAP